MSSNVGQSYPSGSETAAQRVAAVETTLAAFDGLRDRVAAESTPLDDAAERERAWVWVCPAEPEPHGRLHVAGYARDRHALYVVCDTCGRTFLR